MFHTDSPVAVVEFHGSRLAALVEHVSHLVQRIVEGHNGVGLQRLAIDGSRELAVGSHSEAYTLLVATMREHGHLSLVVTGRVQHDIHGETLALQVAFTLSTCR